MYSSTTFALTGCCPHVAFHGVPGPHRQGRSVALRYGKRASDGGFETAFGSTDSSFLVSEAALARPFLREASHRCGQRARGASRRRRARLQRGPGDFTDNGHFFVVTGIDGDGNLRINDPYSAGALEQSLNVDTVLARRIFCSLPAGLRGRGCDNNAFACKTRKTTLRRVFRSEDAGRKRRASNPPRRSRQILITCTIFPCRFDDIEARAGRAWYNAP